MSDRPTIHAWGFHDGDRPTGMSVMPGTVAGAYRALTESLKSHGHEIELVSISHPFDRSRPTRIEFNITNDEHPMWHVLERASDPWVKEKP